MYIIYYHHYQVALQAQIFLTLSLTIHLNHLSLLESLLDYILCPNRAVVLNSCWSVNTIMPMCKGP